MEISVTTIQGRETVASFRPNLGNQFSAEKALTIIEFNAPKLLSDLKLCRTPYNLELLDVTYENKTGEFTIRCTPEESIGKIERAFIHIQDAIYDTLHETARLRDYMQKIL